VPGNQRTQCRKRFEVQPATSARELLADIDNVKQISNKTRCLLVRCQEPATGTEQPGKLQVACLL
jgi:hypothetical protein